MSTDITGQLSIQDYTDFLLEELWFLYIINSPFIENNGRGRLCYNTLVR